MCATIANLCVNSAKPAFQAVAQHKKRSLPWCGKLGFIDEMGIFLFFRYMTIAAFPFLTS